MNDDETGQRRAKRRTNTLRGYHGALGQIEMAGTASQIRDNKATPKNYRSMFLFLGAML